MEQKYTFDYFKKSADYITDIIKEKPEIALILGSALGSMSEEIEDPIVIPYEEIPNFLISTVVGHDGKLIYGKIRGKRVICMSGRFHYYEGYEYEQLVIPIRVFKLLGVESVILTNAVGGINYAYEPGDICLIRDQIKLTGASPLRGPNIDEFGPRFPSVNHIYTKELRELAKECARRVDINLWEGNYYFAVGPQYETPAEIRAMRILGADVVGMSTVTEGITAAHLGMKVMGLSMITNKSSDQVDDHEVTAGVFDLSEVVSGKFRKLVCEIIGAM